MFETARINFLSDVFVVFAVVVVSLSKPIAFLPFFFFGKNKYSRVRRSLLQSRF